MSKRNIFSFIRDLNRPVFTTHELCAVSGKSDSVVTQSLNYLEGQDMVFRIYRGLWGKTENERISPYSIVPFLFPRQRAYVSFVSALHIYGIIEQIPQTVTIASTSHTRTFRTKLGTFYAHQIAPSFFKGFDWYKGNGSFLIAEPEKALVDCFYLSSRRNKRFAHFPELHFSKNFSFKKARSWANSISDAKIKANVLKKLKALCSFSKEGSNTKGAQAKAR